MAAPDPPTRRRRAPPFRPHFTLLLLYFAFFIVLFGVVLVLPALAPLLEQADRLPPEELEKRAFAAARGSMQGRVFLTVVLALATTGVLAGLRRLPGLRDPRRP